MSGTIYRVEKTAAEYRAEAQAERLASQASFERCDTDGALSQWGSDMMAAVNHVLAELAEQGGMAEFVVLCDLQGQEVRARVVSSKYGACWALCDEQDRFTGEFVAYCPARPSTLRRHGFQEVHRQMPAGVRLVGSGYCLTPQVVPLTARYRCG